MWFWLFADSNTPDDSSEGPAERSEQTADTEAMSQAAEAEATSARPPAQEPEHEEHASAMWIVLPWMTSLLLHVAVIVLGTVLVWSYLVIEEELEAVVPTAKLSEQVGGALSESEQMELEAAQDVREVESEEVDSEDAEEELELTDESEMELVGVSGGGGGGKLAPFGTTTGGGGEMGAEFYGTGGNARRIAYIIDASGSMIDTMPFVIEELKRSINDLSEEQEFTVVFYQTDRAIEVPPEGWKEATDTMKRRVANWVTPGEGNITPRGQTNPRPALQLVLRYDPQLIFLLSDNVTGTGRYEIDRSELLSMIDRSSRGEQLAINTIQFMYPDSLDTLEQIADDHGGVFRFITEADLGLRQ